MGKRGSRRRHCNFAVPIHELSNKMSHSKQNVILLGHKNLTLLMRHRDLHANLNVKETLSHPKQNMKHVIHIPDAYPLLWLDTN